MALTYLREVCIGNQMSGMPCELSSYTNKVLEKKTCWVSFFAKTRWRLFSNKLMRGNWEEQTTSCNICTTESVMQNLFY
jgi:hypothetical protein